MPFSSLFQRKAFIQPRQPDQVACAQDRARILNSLARLLGIILPLITARYFTCTRSKAYFSMGGDTSVYSLDIATTPLVCSGFVLLFDHLHRNPLCQHGAFRRVPCRARWRLVGLFACRVHLFGCRSRDTGAVRWRLCWRNRPRDCRHFRHRQQCAHQPHGALGLLLLLNLVCADDRCSSQFGCSSGWTVGSLCRSQMLYVKQAVIRVAGGENLLGTVFAAVDAYNYGTNSWNSSHVLSHARTSIASAAAGRYLVFSGGSLTVGGAGTNFVDIFDVLTATWTSGTCPIAFTQGAATNTHSKAFFFSATSQSIQIFDGQSLSWTSIAPSPAVALHSPVSAVSLNGLILYTSKSSFSDCANCPL